MSSCASVAGSNGKEAQQPSDRLGNDDKDDDVTPSASSVTPSSRKQGRDSLKTLSSDGGRSPANKNQSALCHVWAVWIFRCKKIIMHTR